MSTQSSSREPSGWAAGGVIFAASILGLIGVFHVVAGLAAVFDEDFYVVTANYTFDLDTSAWGWVHLLIGALLLFVSFGLLRGQTWAGVMTIFLALLSAVANFLFIPYYPLWAILMIALNVWVIWAVTRPGALEA